MHLSKLNYYADFFVSMALIALLAIIVMAKATWLQGIEWGIYLCVGAASWTLIEYGFHRWLYHGAPYIRDLHRAHHATPNAHIGAPSLIGIILIFMVCFAPLATTRFFAASGLTAGMLIGYMAYMLVHHACHYWRSTAFSWLYRARLHHALHHYHSDEINFGITTAFWDHVFGTALEPTRRRAEPQLL